MLTGELLIYLFDGQPHILAEPMEAWLKSSRRFTTFITTYHTKIRKKLHTVQEKESLRDLQLELETAYLLLQERSLSLAYETLHPKLGRSPDFAVTFTASLVFMVEVTRLRAVQQRASTDTITNIPSKLVDRFTDMLCDKLGQLMPQHSNVLLVGIEATLMTLSDLNTIMIRIQQRAEGNDSSIVQRYGFRDRADFFRHYGRLSALVVRGLPLRAGEPAVIWINPQAKYPLPVKVRTALTRSHRL